MSEVPDNTIRLVGGPRDGEAIEDPRAGTLRVPMVGESSRFSEARYKRVAGEYHYVETVDVLVAPRPSDNDLYAEIIPTRHGWRWTVEGDIPQEWAVYYRGRYEGRGAPWGETGTRWGARRQARKALAEIRAYQAKESEVIR